jgi:AraC family transcriptional regulator, regulatory protein of adaptative response / DNA-3-methyladenine glycosylase II
VRADGPARHHVEVDVTPSLLPVVMPVIVRVRQLFDLDAEPTRIDAHLAASGLARLVSAHPGVRVPGALDGFDVALRVLLRRASRSQTAYESLAWRVAAALGERVDVGLPCLHHLPPDPQRIASSVEALASLGLREQDATVIVELSRAVVGGRVRLEPGSDPHDLARELTSIGLDEATMAQILARAAAWPDSFSAHDLATTALERRALAQRAEGWRPWRAYAAMHLQMASMMRDASGTRAG